MCNMELVQDGCDAYSNDEENLYKQATRHTQVGEMCTLRQSRQAQTARQLPGHPFA